MFESDCELISVFLRAFVSVVLQSLCPAHFSVYANKRLTG